MIRFPDLTVDPVSEKLIFQSWIFLLRRWENWYLNTLLRSQKLLGTTGNGRASTKWPTWTGRAWVTSASVLSPLGPRQRPILVELLRRPNIVAMLWCSDFEGNKCPAFRASLYPQSRRSEATVPPSGWPCSGGVQGLTLQQIPLIAFAERAVGTGSSR